MVYSNVTGYLSGASLCLHDIKTQKKDYIWSERYGFQAFTANVKRGLIALAEFGLNPSIYIYQYPSKKLVLKIENCSQLEILKLKISRDGKRLLVVSGTPEFNITFWDLDTSEKMAQIDLQTDLNFIDVSFSPKDNSLISILYKETLQFCNMQPCFLKNGENLKETNRFDIKEYPSSHNYKMLWSETNQLYLSQEGRICIIDPITFEEIYGKKYDQQIKHLLLTPKHLITINHNNAFEFLFKYDKLNINDEELLPFLSDRLFNFQDGNIENAFYTNEFQNIIIQTVEGANYSLDIPAETFVEEEEDENQDNGKQNKKRENIIKCTPLKLSQFFTGPTVFLKELRTQDVLVAISQNGEIQLWNTKEKTLLYSVYVSGKIVCGDISLNDKFLVLGTSSSCIRIMDLKSLVTLKSINCVQFGSGEYENRICVSSQESCKVFLVQVDEFAQSVQGFQALPNKVVSCLWHNSAYIIAIIKGLVFAIPPPEKNDNQDAQILVRKTDPDMNKICLTNHSDILLTGQDRNIKRYKFPEESLAKMDLKVKLPAPSPIEEVEGQQLPSTYISLEKDLIVQGCQDGEICFRNINKMNEVTRQKVMNFQYNGVRAMYFSIRSQLIYIGGEDGSIIVFQNNMPVFIKPVSYFGNKIQDESNITNYDSIKDYKTVRIQEQEEADSAEREKMKQDRLLQIQQIKQKLAQILEQNEKAEQPDRLDRNEIVIDINARDAIFTNGEILKKNLKEDCEIKRKKLQLEFQKIKEATWDNMDTHLKSVNGLQSETIIFNYHMLKIDKQEQSIIDKIIDLRRIEIREKLEVKSGEILNINDIGKKLENYVINSFSGKQVNYVLNDYEKKDETQDKAKADQRKGVKRQSIVQVDELKENKEIVQNMKPEQKKNIEDFTIWDYLYGSFELFSNTRKTNQLYIIKRIIQEIKKDFNKEFEQMIILRQNQADQISERNKRISEILSDLQKPLDLFVPKKNYLEDAENILKVDDNEILFDRYLSKDERQKLEAARLKEEQRLRELAQDDSGVRALKDMMNGTLEVKKENLLNEVLQKEEWMNKPTDEMNDDEKLKLREYEIKEQKQNEEKEKIKKNLENELKKLRGEISEICLKFDEKIQLFLKRKLEYDQRVAEQQLYIIKLTNSIMHQKDSKVKVQMLKQEIDQSEQTVQQQKQLKQALEQHKEVIDQDYKVNQENYNGALDSKQKNLGFDVNKVRNIYSNVFEESKKDEKKRIEIEQKIMANQKYKQILITLDPFLELEKNDIKTENEQQFQSFHDEINEKINNLQLDDENKKEQIINQLNNKFQLKKALELTEYKRQRILTFINFFDSQNNQINQDLNSKMQNMQTVNDSLFKSLLDIEVQIRLKQGLVEIPQQQLIAEDHIVLVQRDVIENKNSDIINQGTNVIKQMRQIQDTKLDVAKLEHELKIQELKVRELELKTKEVQMLKVKKEMQQALTKKDTKLNEFELHNLQEQIEKVVQTTEKRIHIYRKKEEKINKDIEFIVKETEQLKLQGSSLDDTVKQRKEISEMMFKKNQDRADTRSDNEQFDKFKQISYNRKLYDLVKRQTEEIELLKEELQRLKLKTFADFSNIK